MIYISFKTFKQAFYFCSIVITLEMRWEGMNTDLSRLSELIQDFFRKKEFKVTADKINNEYRIIANPRQFHGIIEKILITVSGSPSNFTVKMTATAKSRSLVLLGNLVSLFGFGFLAVKGHQSEENLEKLERELKVFIAEKVWQVSHATA